MEIRRKDRGEALRAGRNMWTEGVDVLAVEVHTAA
jgi:hypothetical protein